MANETIPAGLKTDMRVAVEVMELQPRRDIYPELAVDPYSTCDAAALEVVEALRRRGWLVILKAMPDGLPFLAFEETEIRVQYVCEGQWMKHHTRRDCTLRIYSHPVGMADTLALAVCRAALQCVRAEKEQGR